MLACCGSNAPVAGDSMIGRNKEGPMVKQRADEVLKNPAKDTVSSPFSNWRKHGTKTAFIHRRECQNAADDLNRRTSRGAVTRF